MIKLRNARVFYNEDLAGHISETADGYLFQYHKDFLKKNIPISISLPIREEPYASTELFSFFRGLLPEGWYLDIVTATQKVDREDLFGLLICTTGVDTIGAVTVRRTDGPING
ncbi:MAG: HipA N-terminal domain-containing protein [Candidatus Omnitrophota bacterium]